MLNLPPSITQRIGEICGECFPIDVEALARRLGVKHIEPRNIQIEGYLGRDPQGDLVIRYRQDSCLTRQRFTIAHEIGHLLVAESEGRTITTTVTRDRAIRDEDEERVANRIAAEILMPTGVVHDRFAQLSPDWSTFHKECSYFGVSASALIRRLVEVPSLGAVVMHVKSQGDFQLQVFTGRNTRCLFTSKPESVIRRIFDESTQSNLHYVELEVDRVAQLYWMIGRPIGAGYQLCGWQSGHARKRPN